jgi:hypothetical protein
MRHIDRVLKQLEQNRAYWSTGLVPGEHKYPAGATEKPCTKCKVIKSLDDYSPLKQGALGRNPVCKECRRAAGKEQTRRDREAKAGRARPERCECCLEPPQRRALHWDHNHATGEFRGWLCHGCNTLIGSAKDSIEVLECAIRYLRTHC